MVAELHNIMNKPTVKPEKHSEKHLSRHEKLMYHGVPVAALALGVAAAGAGLALNHLNESTEIGTSVETVQNGDGAINTVERGVRDVLENHPTIDYDSVAGVVGEGMAVDGTYVTQNHKPLQAGTQVEVGVRHNNWNTTYVEAKLADPANLAHLDQPNK